jgi:hypothetical protein
LPLAYRSPHQFPLWLLQGPLLAQGVGPQTAMSGRPVVDLPGEPTPAPQNESEVPGIFSTSKTFQEPENGTFIVFSQVSLVKYTQGPSQNPPCPSGVGGRTALPSTLLGVEVYSL